MATYTWLFLLQWRTSATHSQFTAEKTHHSPRSQCAILLTVIAVCKEHVICHLACVQDHSSYTNSIVICCKLIRHHMSVLVGTRRAHKFLLCVWSYWSVQIVFSPTIQSLQIECDTLHVHALRAGVPGGDNLCAVQDLRNQIHVDDKSLLRRLNMLRRACHTRNLCTTCASVLEIWLQQSISLTPSFRRCNRKWRKLRCRTLWSQRAPTHCFSIQWWMNVRTKCLYPVIAWRQSYSSDYQRMRWQNKK